MKGVALSLLDELGKVLDVVETATPVDLVNGVRSAWTDVPNLVGDVATGDLHSALNDGRKVVGDANDIAQGLTSLGVSMGPVSGTLSNSPVVKLAESKVLSAAQLAIELLRKSTGAGDPCTGDEFRESSGRLETVVDTLIKAEPHTDRWDGTASQIYNAVNASHRRCASDVQAADLEIAKIIDTEAGQVSRTRTTLDETSQNLTDYDLATCWMNTTPPSAAIKFAMDVAAAAAAMATVDATIGVLVKNSIENAFNINQHISKYDAPGRDTSGNPAGGCDIFSLPDDEHPLALPDDATPLPGADEGTRPPSRSLPGTPYTVPGPEVPPPSVPATPYGSTTPPPADTNGTP